MNVLYSIFTGQAEDALIMRVSAAVLTEKADKKYGRSSMLCIVNVFSVSNV